jgi:dipeptidyl aminopeptidase/acylaminoacyl peptidase
LCEPPKDEAGRDGRGARASATDSAKAGEGDTAAVAPKIFRMASRVGPDGRPLGPEEILDGECPEFVADVDIWHVGDERLQSVQILRASRDRSQTYMGVVHVDSGQRARFVQLADTTMESVVISDNGRYAMGSNARPYASDWEPSYADYYLVDMETGARTQVLEKHLRTLGFSPDGKRYLYWKDRHVWSFDVAGGNHTNLTETIPVTFEDEEFDRMGEKPPHGIAGWAADSSAVILEHRYDLWLQPLDGGEATNLTQGVGAQQEIQFRIVDLDPDEDLTDLSEPLVLSAYGQWTKRAGFYGLDNDRLRELVMDDASFGRVSKADSTDVILFTKEDFETFPDYHVSGVDFRNPQQVTDANPQQAEFNWGRQILFDYETADGIRLQGILAIPYDYVEGEERPMLVDFYEKNSQSLNAYHTPIFRDSPMFSAYVSAGYLVMRPDIHFRLGATHAQMLECINLAIDRVVEMGYVDEDRIGLHGHSFSGQGSAYIATHSDRFAAIVAGAAATDLLSDFNQLWKSSGTNQHGYDTYGQGRFGTSPYDDLDLFLDQSATPNAGNMNTPLLLLHGTADGSVEWLQAVEFFNGLRWFDKNVILMSYPGEPHHLAVWENQKDFQIRMRQFYDHYLWDKPAPRWMESGRTFLDKERDRAMVEKEGSGGRSGGGRPGGGGE